jgi:hypothetical protein
LGWLPPTSFTEEWTTAIFKFRDLLFRHLKTQFSLDFFQAKKARWRETASQSAMLVGHAMAKLLPGISPQEMELYSVGLP